MDATNNTASEKPDNISTSDETIRNAIIELLIDHDNVYFKSQQIGEPELSSDDKRSIVKELLDKNKCFFLQRYGQYLGEEHLTYFATQDDGDVDILIKDLQSRLKLKKKMIRNRRYKAMQDLLEKGVYFSQSEMQTRDPYLFEQMVGQYLSMKEKKNLQNEHYRNNYDQPGFSSFLMEQIRTIHMKCDYFIGEKEHMMKAQKHNEDEDGQEEDDEKEQVEDAIEAIASSINIDAKDKETLRQEFKELMMQHFLNGLDTDYFDYSQVDTNDSYDFVDEFDRDCEDEYFDAE